MNILVYGTQGSGKSTHAKYIADKLGVPYVYTGDLFREVEKETSDRGEKIRELMAQGILIPNELSIPAFGEYLDKFDLSKGVVLDGYPRNLDQAESLPFKIDLIINISLPEGVAIERLLARGRYDDTPQAIKKRMQLFKKDTQPLYSYYRSKGAKVVEVDNSPSVEEVQGVIDGLLENKK